MAAAAPPVANGRPAPVPKVPSGFRIPWIWWRPSRGVGRVDADGLEPGGGHPDLLEAAGVLAEVGDRLADHVGVVDLQLGGGHQADGRGDDVGLAARRRGEPAARDPARLDVIHAAQDVGHRAAHVPEDPQARVGRTQAGRLAHRLRGEAPVRVLMRGGDRPRSAPSRPASAPATSVPIHAVPIAVRTKAIPVLGLMARRLPDARSCSIVRTSPQSARRTTAREGPGLQHQVTASLSIHMVRSTVAVQISWSLASVPNCERLTIARMRADFQTSDL